MPWNISIYKYISRSKPAELAAESQELRGYYGWKDFTTITSKPNIARPNPIEMRTRFPENRVRKTAKTVVIDYFSKWLEAYVIRIPN
jgi:hypothetical protein